MDDINRFLLEDLDQKGDITSDALFIDEEGAGDIIAKQRCIVAGLQEAKTVFARCGAEFRGLSKDGEIVEPKTNIATVHGPLKSILKAERLSLNFLGRMSGIATTTYDLVQRCKRINPDVTIAATRKTTPGFRVYEKKAVQIGGGEPHRYGLFDAIMIKDNHLKYVTSISEALKRIEKNKPNVVVEIEVENEHDALIAASYNIDVIMLDNFTPEAGQKTSQKIREKNPNILIELSGGITPDNIEQYASFADRISLGYLTHSITNKDFSLELH
jgi:nicotinate-nucleotide pyrophosphorylase (carboxylating)